MPSTASFSASGFSFSIATRNTPTDFRELLVGAGVRVVRLSVRSPDLNACAERFMLSIKSECLDRMIFFTEASLRRAVRAFVDHDHRERCHQGLDNQLIEPVAGDADGKVRCRERLGGRLRYYYRQAAQAGASTSLCSPRHRIHRVRPSSSSR